MNERSWTFWVGAAAVLGLALLAAFTVKNEYFFFAAYVVLQFVVLATAWNILGGYAGYVNFGTSAFFGVGAYIAVMMIKAVNAPLGLQILAAAAVGGVMGVSCGLLTLRLRGIFFSIATVAVAIILETVINNWRFVGGATGVQILRPPVMEPFDSYTKMIFVVAALLAILAVATARYIQTSWIGRGLRAIRDNEEAAECAGVPTLKLKLLACAVSGALMGAIGAPLAMYQSFVEPASAFNLNYSVSALAMPIIGGTSHWIGPVIGAVLLGSVQQIVTVTITSELNVMVVGVLLVVFVVGAPDGIVGLFNKYWKRRRGAGTKP
ncbi:MAG: branched-chain amino acid ABC transporter permease [Proteobacteria bacterium]|nr:branched-chain amino acid ABC transporter permease [Pseudomonadota bacterium]